MKENKFLFSFKLVFWKICLKSALLPFYPFNFLIVLYIILTFDTLIYSSAIYVASGVRIHINFWFSILVFFLFFSLFNSFCSQPVIIFSSLLCLHLFFIIFSSTFLLNIFLSNFLSLFFFSYFFSFLPDFLPFKFPFSYFILSNFIISFIFIYFISFLLFFFSISLYLSIIITLLKTQLYLRIES